MLKYKINVLGANITKKQLFPERLLLNEDENSIIFEFNNNNLHTMDENDSLFLNRGDNETVYLENEYYSQVIDKKSISINGLSEYSLTNYWVEEISDVYCPAQTFNKAIKFNFYDNEMHDFFTIRKGGVREDLNCTQETPCDEDETQDLSVKNYIYYNKNNEDEYTYIIDEYRRYCANEYVLSDSKFLLKSIGIDVDGYYIFDENSLKNTKQTLYFYDENNEKISFECMIPFSSSDRRNELYYFYNENDDNDKIIEAINNNTALYSEDDRYFKIDKSKFIIKHISNLNGEEVINEIIGDEVEYDTNNNLIKIKYNGITTSYNLDEIKGVYRELIPHKGTKFYKEFGDFKLKIPIEEAFETNISQRDDIVEHYVGERANELINPIVDMEKQIFVPVIGEYVLETISGDENITEEWNDNKKSFSNIGKKYWKNENNVVTYIELKYDVVCDNVKEIFFNLNFLSRYISKDVDNWKISSEPIKGEKRNVTRLEKYVDSKTKERCENPKASHLLDLGYTDKDLEYQKMCVKKSFIRFSYFNKQSRANQALLYYSTIYLDSGEIYGKILKGDKCIGCSVSVCNSFNRSKSSEGYYLYLFPSVLGGKEDEWVTIYMKVDFNHAKYGYTIPMSSPTNDEYKENGYIKMSKGNYTEQKKALDNDICFPIRVRYNTYKRRYEWCVEDKYMITNNQNEGIITYNLYEPIVNYQEKESQE